MEFSTKQRLRSLGNAIKIIRVTGWLHFLGLFILGYIYAASTLKISATFGGGLAASIFYLAFTFAYNNLHDRRLDDPQKNPLVEEVAISPLIKNAIYALAVLTAVGAGMISFTMFGLFLFMLFVSWLYSGPVRAKKLFIAGTFLNAPIFIPLFLAGIAVFRAITLKDIWLCLLFSFSILIPQLAHELQDRVEDERLRIQTLGVRLGIAGVINLMIVMCALQGAYGFLLFKFKILNLPAATAVGLLSLAEAFLAMLFLNRRENFIRLRLGMRFLNMAYGFGLILIWLRV